MHLLKFHKEWVEFDRVCVERDGIQYEIRVSTNWTVFPYTAECISVTAHPIKGGLMTDILASDVQIEVRFLNLCRAAKSAQESDEKFKGWRTIES